MKLWVGKEREGRYEGMQTLFVGSKSITFDEIDKVLKEHPIIRQIYFGAGKCTPINQDVVRECFKKYKRIITMEIDLRKLHYYDLRLLKKACVIVTHNHENYGLANKLLYSTTQIKIQNLIGEDKVLGIAPIYNFNQTHLDDLEGKIYRGDKVIK